LIFLTLSISSAVGTSFLSLHPQAVSGVVFGLIPRLFLNTGSGALTGGGRATLIAGAAAA
jgi:hypothetical protein